MRVPRWLPATLVAATALAMLLHGPIPQLPHYHDFADGRALAGIPHAANVLSNIAFALVAAWGFAVLRRRWDDPGFERARAGYALFVAALALTAVGSSWYHLAPDNGRLLFDRAPIALACAGLLGGVHADTHASRHPLAITATLALAGVASVLWWSFTEARGAGDLRPYLLLQGAPLLLVPLWQAMDEAPHRERYAFAAAIALYAVAKAAELADHSILLALGFVSGHTLKHLLAAAASAAIVATFALRERGAEDPHEAIFALERAGFR
jgi:hypothetical protein